MRVGLSKKIGLMQISEFVESRLTHLSSYYLIILSSAVIFQLIFLLSRFASQNSKHYSNLSIQKQVDWGMHVVSQVFAILVSLACVVILTTPALYNNPIWGVSTTAEHIYAIGAGYFLWDIYITIAYYHLTGPAFLFHGITAFVVSLGLYVLFH